MSTNLSTKSSKRLGIDFIGKLIYKAAISKDDYEGEFLHIVGRAKQDIYDAENFFDNVTDPELVDHAIYKIEAAKSHYTYLIKQAKEKGIRVII